MSPTAYLTQGAPRFLRWRMQRAEALFACAIFSVAMMIALPLSFEFRQRVSIAGVTVTEFAFVGVVAVAVMSRFGLLFFHRHRLFGMVFFTLLAWIAARSFVAMLEGVEIVRMFRDLRHYLSFALVPICLGLFHSIPEARRVPCFAALVRALTLAYGVYVLFLLAVVFLPPLREPLLMEPNAYRIGSSTGALAVPLIMLCVGLYRHGLIKVHYIILAVICGGVSILLGQGRMSTAISAGMLGLVVLLYTVRRQRTGWLNVGLALSGGIVSAGLIAYVMLDLYIPDFERFTKLFVERVASHQADTSLLESVSRHSLGYAEFRERVWEAITDRPFVGYGEGATVGRTMSLDEGTYIDSTILTMWYKNGVVGVLLLYALYCGLLAYLLSIWMRGGSGLAVELSSILIGSLTGWLLLSVSNVLLMYGWVMYPIFALLASGIGCLRSWENGSTRLPPVR